MEAFGMTCLYLDLSRDYKGNLIPHLRYQSLVGSYIRLRLDIRTANDISHFYNSYLVKTYASVYVPEVGGFENGLMTCPYHESTFMTVHPDRYLVVLKLRGNAILSETPTHVVGLEYVDIKVDIDVPFTVCDTRDQIELGFFSAEDYMKWELSM